MKTARIIIAGVGSVQVDRRRGTLEPATHVVGQRLGVGYGHATIKAQEAAADRRAAVVAEARKLYGEPECGWLWLDHNGCTWGAA